MQRVTKSVLEEGLSVWRAVEHKDNPLNDRRQGTFIHERHSGPSRYLNDARDELML